jgi:hypothetical protein
VDYLSLLILKEEKRDRERKGEEKRRKEKEKEKRMRKGMGVVFDVERDMKIKSDERDDEKEILKGKKKKKGWKERKKEMLKYLTTFHLPPFFKLLSFLNSYLLFNIHLSPRSCFRSSCLYSSPPPLFCLFCYWC